MLMKLCNYYKAIYFYIYCNIVKFICYFFNL